MSEESPLPDLQDDRLLAVSSWWKKRVLVSSASSKGTNPFMGLRPHDLMVGASTYELGVGREDAHIRAPVGLQRPALC